MTNKILGIHHITAIAGSAQKNFEFYTRVLGLRMVKKTVNFDDPGTYHFYFGDEVGTPGSILTFFPWEGIQQGKTGTGMATEIGYSVPQGSLDFWAERLAKHQVTIIGRGTRLGEEYLLFQDPDGLQLAFIVSSANDQRKGWTTKDVNADRATKGFHSISITLKRPDATASILTDIFGYQLKGEEGNRMRFVTDAIEGANIVDLIAAPNQQPAVNAAGTIHHVAFRVKDEETLMAYREKVVRYGLGITQKIDRNYFYSLYFREPGGVLFEIATDNPGFAVDEAVNELGTHLKLPAQYEGHRSQIEKSLPVLV